MTSVTSEHIEKERIYRIRESSDQVRTTTGTILSKTRRYICVYFSVCVYACVYLCVPCTDVKIYKYYHSILQSLYMYTDTNNKI